MKILNTITAFFLMAVNAPFSAGSGRKKMRCGGKHNGF